MTIWRATCYLGERSLQCAAGQAAERGGLSEAARSPLHTLGTGVAALPGNHGAGVRLARGGGGGAQLGEPAVAGLQAGHGTSEVFRADHLCVVHHFTLV